MFPKDSIFYTYKKFSNIKDIMMRVDACSIKPEKEVNQDPDCSYFI